MFLSDIFDGKDGGPGGLLGHREHKKIWAFPGLFLEFIIFPWFIVYITIYNYFLAMVIGNRKEEGRVCMSSIHCSLEKARRPARIEPVTNSEPEKAKSVPG